MGCMEQADIIVIGSGQGGVPLAADFAQEGKKVVLFERGRFGGTCVNYGCTPSKAFLASAHAAGRAKLAGRLGVDAQVRVDFPAVMERVQGYRDSSSAGGERRVGQAGVRLVGAEARFVGERTVRGGDVEVRAETVVINTGGTPVVPAIPGLAGTPFLTSDTFWSLRQQPRRFLVLGGGYIGLELGQGMTRLGSEVHIIDPNQRLMAREEPEVGAALQKALEGDGAKIHLQAKAVKVEYDGVFTLYLENGERLEGEGLLVATGRKANVEALSLDVAGIKLGEKGYIQIDQQFRTSASGVFAIGDVAGQPAFTHVSWEDYRRLKAILKGQNRTKDDRVLGYAAFTDPQLGRVGLTLEQAQKAGHQAKAVTLPLEKVARAWELDEMNGFFRLVVDQESEKILGATLVGYEAAEVVHTLLAHMEAGSSWRVLERSVHIHPALGEGLPSLARLLM